jgi:dTDP-4-amino-4,6-dideoxygalactose transaminase
MRKLPRFVERRTALVARYDAALKPLAPIVKPVTRAGGAPAWHLYVALIDFETLGKDRASVMRALMAAGVGTQVHYLPVHLQPYYQQRYGRRHLPGAERYYTRCLSLPLFPAMSDADVDRVVAALANIVRG